MTHPASSPRRAKTLTGPLIGALLALLALAVVTVIVVINKGSTEKPSSGSTGSSSGGSSSSSQSKKKITDDSLGVSYSYVTEGYEKSRWHGPSTITLGTVTLDAGVTYDACTPAAGSDLLLGVTDSDQSDLATAAEDVANEVAKAVWLGEGDPKLTDSPPPSEQTTHGGITGQLFEISAIRPSGPDACGTDLVHIGTFAMRGKDDKTVVMVASYRTNGELPKQSDAFSLDVTSAMKSLERT